MDVKRVAFITTLGFALAALAMPFVVLRAPASASVALPASATAKAAAFRNSGLNVVAPQSDQQREVLTGETSEGRISASTLKALGLTRAANSLDASNRIGQRLQETRKKSGNGEVTIQSGQPTVLNARSALSAALITTIGGRDNHFPEVTLIADWDGREDCAADREQKQDFFFHFVGDNDQAFTRAAISEHTVANGFQENVFYYGDSLGNLWVGTDTNPGINVPQFGTVDSLLQVDIPRLVNTGTSGFGGFFELFNEGSQASTGSGGEITFAKPDFDLRFEGNDAATCTSSRQRDANRGKVCFLGVGCAPPANPICSTVVTGTFVTTPTTTGLVNAICQVQLNLVGCGFFPNEVTTICQGFEAETGVPLQRPGKTVSTAATLACDTNADGIAESVVVLTNVTPVSCNLITATIPVTATLPGTGFPAACCGGPATVTVTTTFSEGDNNIFGPFTRTTVCNLALGNRAPVVFSATPSTQVCNGLEDLLITGACFQFVGLGGANGTTLTTFSATSVFLQDKATGALILPCAPFVIINNNLIDVNFCMTSSQAGHSFLVFVTNAFGKSRNLTARVTGQPGAPCPTTGNEAGIQVTFACNGAGTPPFVIDPVVPSVTSCHLGRQDTGQFFLDVMGTNIKPSPIVTVGVLHRRRSR